MTTLVTLTGVVITLLVFLRLPRVQLEMDVDTTSVSFRTVAPTQITALSALALLSATEFAPIDFQEPRGLRNFSLAPPLELRPIKETGRLSLSAVTLPANTQIVLERTGDSGTWHIEIGSPEAKIAATLAGKVTLAAAGKKSEVVEFGRGGRLVLSAAAGSRHLDLYLTPTDPSSLLTGQPVEIDDVDFEEVFQQGTSDAIGVLSTRTSSVLKGTLLNMTMNGREETLRGRTVVDMKLRRGYVRELRLQSDTIHVSLSADASEVQLGSAGALKTVRPSYLEWLAEHHAIRFAWAGAAWLFALIVGGVKWWRSPEI